MFTRQLIEEIKNKLYLLGKKDSLFDLVKDVGNDAYFSIVVDGENKRVSVQKFIDIVAEAISESKVGISLEFGDSILEGVSLKTLTEALNAIYVVDEDSIIARSIYRTVILPPNMDEHNSCKLTQDMLLTPNTKYVIKYNYDVVENITMPANCILSVDGGKLFSSSGMKTITGVRNTFPDNGDYTLFETILPDEVCVDLDSITLTNFSYASESGPVDPSKIPAQSIDNTKLEDGAVTEPILANDAVTENKIANNAITEGKIAADAVTSAKIATDAITSNKINNGAITESKIGSSAVTSSKIAAGAITEGKINNGAVTTDKIDGGAITTDKISGEAVTPDKIQYGAVSKDKLSAEVKDRIDDTYTKAETWSRGQLYTRADVYTKTEIGTMFTPSDKTPVVTLSAEEGDDPVTDVLDNVPEADRPNKIFRVRNADNTAFSEYAYLGDDNWELLANRQYGIDEEPIFESTNLISSDAVAKVAGTNVPTETEMMYAITDEEGKLLLGLKTDGEAEIPGLPTTRGTSNLNMIQMTLDEDDRIVSYRTSDGTLHENKIDIQDIEIGIEGVKHLQEKASLCIEPLSDYDGFDIPRTDGEAMVLSKADSMSHLEWIPKSDVPARWLYSNNTKRKWYQKGEAIPSIPYSQTLNINKVVGYDVSLETFMTAVNNPYSLMYTEFLSRDYPMVAPFAPYPQSAYGVIDRGTTTYNGHTFHDYRTYKGISGFANTYYGNVCSAFSSYCIGLSDFYGTDAYPDILNKMYKVIGKLHPQNAQGIRTGDILYFSGHCCVIKNVKRNDSGSVDVVVTVEQAGTYIYETERTAQKFDEYLNTLKNKDVTLYRAVPKQIEKNTEKFTFDAANYIYNNDICTFAGNKALFREGEIIFIHCLNMSYPQMELWKDDVLLETITLASDSRVSRADQDIIQPDVNGQFISLLRSEVLAGASPNYYFLLNGNENPVPAYAVNLSASNLTYGKYKARLKNGNTFSDYTYFDIIEANCTVDNPSVNPQSTVPADSARISFSSHNATPVAIHLALPNESGYIVGRYSISPEDYTIVGNGGEGSLLFNVNYFLAQGAASERGGRRSADLISSDGECLVTVSFETSWGRVTNTPIRMTFEVPNE